MSFNNAKICRSSVKPIVFTAGFSLFFSILIVMSHELLPWLLNRNIERDLIALSSRGTCVGSRCLPEINLISPTTTNSINARIGGLDFIMSLSWAPNAHDLVLSSVGDIYLADPFRGTIVNVTRDISLDGGIRWSPEGEQIAYISYEENRVYFRIVDLDTFSITSLKLADYLPPFSGPVDWSPDGNYVVLAAPGNPTTYEPNDIYLIDTNQRNLTNLTDDPADDYYPTFSASGEQIAFVSDRSGEPQIYIMNLDGGGVTQLTDFDGAGGVPEWVLDDSAILYGARSDGPAHLRISNVATQTSSSVPNTSSLYESAISPDRSHVTVLTSQDGVDFNLCIINLEDFTLEHCINVNAFDESYLAWGN